MICSLKLEALRDILQRCLYSLLVSSFTLQRHDVISSSVHCVNKTTKLNNESMTRVVFYCKAKLYI